MTRVEQRAQRGALCELDRLSDQHQCTRRIEPSHHGENASPSRSRPSHVRGAAGPEGCYAGAAKIDRIAHRRQFRSCSLQTSFCILPQADEIRGADKAPLAQSYDQGTGGVTNARYCRGGCGTNCHRGSGS